MPEAVSAKGVSNQQVARDCELERIHWMRQKSRQAEPVGLVDEIAQKLRATGEQADRIREQTGAHFFGIQMTEVRHNEPARHTTACDAPLLTYVESGCPVRQGVIRLSDWR